MIGIEINLEFGKFIIKISYRKKEKKKKKEEKKTGITNAMILQVLKREISELEYFELLLANGMSTIPIVVNFDFFLFLQLCNDSLRNTKKKKNG